MKYINNILLLYIIVQSCEIVKESKLTKNLNLYSVLKFKTLF